MYYLLLVPTYYFRSILHITGYSLSSFSPPNYHTVPLPIQECTWDGDSARKCAELRPPSHPLLPLPRSQSPIPSSTHLYLLPSTTPSPQYLPLVYSMHQL